MKNPENRELDYHDVLSVVNTHLMERGVVRRIILDGSMLPITIGKNFNVYYGAMYHDDILREKDDVLMEAYAKYANGKVNIIQGPHHKYEVDRKMVEAAEDLLTKEYEKFLKSYSSSEIKGNHD